MTLVAIRNLLWLCNHHMIYIIYFYLIQDASELASYFEENALTPASNLEISWSTAQCPMLSGDIVLVDWYVYIQDRHLSYVYIYTHSVTITTCYQMCDVCCIIIYLIV